ncbi:MAG: fimbrillin family protein [Dysgonamonadaceae bacterium]|nr:fimbrillin family protein [Dysgonamonadaceae bacterium]
MKKSNLFLMLLTALIVMSCSKDETTMGIPQEGNAIEFGTYVGRDAQTRGTVINETNLPTLGFGVFAYYTDGGDYTVGTSTPNFMYNTKVSTASWTYAPIKYWPNETTDKLTFFAYAPYSDGTQNNISDFTTNTTPGDPTLKFTVNETAKSQSDLLYAEATTDNLINQSKQTIGGKVVFPFKHALSRIGFKVEVMSDVVNHDTETGEADTTGEGAVTSKDIDEATTVSVQKVELIGAFTTANKFNFATGGWSTTGTDITTSATTAATYKLDYNSDETTSDFINTVATAVTTAPQVLNATTSYLMIIPKTFVKAVDDTNDPLQIRVTYKVTTTDGALSGGKSEITNVITSDPFAFTFEAGKAYSFNLHLGLTSVKFSATVEGWDETTPGIVVNVPINTN